MDNGLNLLFLEDPLDQRAVRNISPDKTHAGNTRAHHRRLMACAEVVQDNWFIPAPAEVQYHLTADIAGASCYQNFQFSSPFSMSSAPPAGFISYNTGVIPVCCWQLFKTRRENSSTAASCTRLIRLPPHAP